MKRFLLLLLAPLLSACPNESRGLYDKLHPVPTDPMRVTVQPARAEVGEPVQVEVTGTLALDPKS